MLVEVPADVAATVEDARMTHAAAPLIGGRGELTALALWLLAERAAVRVACLVVRYSVCMHGRDRMLEQKMTVRTAEGGRTCPVAYT